MGVNAIDVAVLGGSGVSGAEVVSALHQRTALRFRIGGRDRARLEVAADRWDRDRVELCVVDLEDPVALRSFVEGAKVVVNAVGPAVEVGDRVARAALHAGASVVELGGYDPLLHQLEDLASATEAAGCTVVVGAGWMPGISGVFPTYVLEEARRSFEEIKSVRLYYGARDAWGTSGARDMVWSVFQDWIGVFEDGVWRRRPFWSPGHPITLPAPMGRVTARPFFDDQLRGLVELCPRGHFGTYVTELGALASFVFMLVRVFGHERSRIAAKAVQWCIARDARRLGPAGMLHVIVQGRRNGEVAAVTGTLTTTENHRMTGVAAGLAVEMLLAGELRPGIGYLNTRADVSAFMRALRASHIPFDMEVRV